MLWLGETDNRGYGSIQNKHSTIYPSLNLLPIRADSRQSVPLSESDPGKPFLPALDLQGRKLRPHTTISQSVSAYKLSDSAFM